MAKYQKLFPLTKALNSQISKIELFLGCCRYGVKQTRYALDIFVTFPLLRNSPILYIYII